MPKVNRKKVTKKTVSKKTVAKKVKAKKKTKAVKGNGLRKNTKKTNKTHSVTVEGMPEGWRAIAYRKPLKGDHFLLPSQNGRADYAVVMKAEKDFTVLPYLVVEKE